MNEIGRRIAEKIIDIHGSNDFRIAFLPYKRSMWGCMASVYQELKASGADARCMPIPYAAVDGKGIHIEFDKAYDRADDFRDLPVFKPDYVVIHYQYETSNKVTHMLPWFCAETLSKRYKVIYIPYGNVTEHELIMCPGFQFMDFIFLNTEAERELFLEEWSAVGIDMKDKVIVCGSPKVDAVMMECSGVKGDAVLIVNSLGALLNGGPSHMAKYLEIAEEELQKGKKVIFRPHPLMKQAIKALTPELVVIYDLLLDTLRHYGVRVDDKPYIERTMAEAAELISDPSSVIDMWMPTGKPYRMIGGE